MVPAISFNTARLDVAPWETVLDDARMRPGFVAALVNLLTPDVARYLPPVWHLADAHDDMDGWIAARRAASAIACVHERQHGALAGLCVMRPGSEDGVLTVGYLFGTPHWGRGYATELVRGVIGWAGRNGYERLEAGVVRDNAASFAVLVKAGFSPAGRMEDGVDAYGLDIAAGPG